MDDLITAADAARECLENSISLANMARRATSDTAQDALTLGQLYALIAIAAELRRANDRNERLDSQFTASMDERATTAAVLASDDPFMPPDGFWRWFPKAKHFAVDANGKGFWYDGEIKPSEDEWFMPGIGTNAEIGFCGVRDLAGIDWRTTKRTRPAHL